MGEKRKIGDIEYILKESRRAKNVRLSVYRDCRVEVILPQGLPVSIVEEFILKKSAWILRKLRSFRKKYSSGIVLPKPTRRNFLFHKTEARELIKERLEEVASFYNVNFHKVSIRNQKSRWGSCSRSGNLSFNWRVAYLPEALRDYVLAHEVCHLLEFNHSQKFWDQVARSCPDHKRRRKELRGVR